MTLNAEDLDLVRREPGLPGLPWLLDADRFAELADQLAPAAGIVAAELTYLRYKPGTSTLAAFRLLRRNGASWLVQAKALPSARYRVVAGRLADQGPAAPDHPAPAAVDALQLVVLRPCDDRKLKAIAELDDPLQRQRLLAASAGAFGIAGCELDGVDVLRYKPERRLVACLRNGPSAVALLRVVERGHFATALLGATLGAATCGAPLIGADARRQTLVTAWTEGEPLRIGRPRGDKASAGPPSTGPLPWPAAAPSGAIAQGDGRQDDVHAAGSLLARLHATKTLPPIIRSRGDDQEAVRRSLAMLAHLLPGTGARLQRLLGQIPPRLAAMPWEAALLHGDFSADQIIVDRGHCRFIDWDRAAAGAAATDLGSFAARLEMQVIEGRLTPAEARDTIARLHEGYRLTAGQLPPGVDLHRALSLLQLATESFRRRLPDWPARETALLARAEALLHRLAHRPSSPAAREPGPDEAGTAEADPLLAKVLDRRWLGPALVQALGPAYQDARLHDVRLIRHKPGRRALIACELGETVLGKLRYKGLDRHGFEVQRALARQRANRNGSATGDPDHRDEARIPEVLGSCPDVGLWFQRWLPGTPAGDLLRPDSDPLITRRIGVALAGLHASPVATRRCWTVDNEVAVLRERLGQAGQRRPDLATRIDQVMAACATLAADLPALPGTGIHRDFHPDQVLVDGERLVFVDFDLYALGDPALDVGNWLAHLIELALRHHGGAMALARHGEAFVDGYRQRCPDLPDAAIAGWTSLSLARHIALSLDYADRRATTAALLNLCERRLAIFHGQT